uniref:Uncharacterized protein n=1 Tax=viral metagenome TaxID=1070528 RepID=A0A6C0LTI9_9ZZZZ
MFKIQKITIGIVLFGKSIRFTYLSYVRTTELVNTFIPIGQEIKYIIDSVFYQTYQPLPMIVYHKNHRIEIMEEEKFDIILRFFYRKMKDLDMKLYLSNGVIIEYINQDDIINWDSRITTLVRGKVPKQNHIRALIDISDQLFDHNPRINIKITFYTKGRYDPNYLIKENPFYIEQINTFMEYKYDESDLIFFNNVVGFFGYNIITGEVKSKLTDELEDYLIKSFRKNFPHSVGLIEIFVMVLQIDANYRSIIYN